MQPQVMWNTFKNIRHENKSGEADLIDQRLIQYALDAVDEVEMYKFQNDAGIIRLRNSSEVVL